MSSNKRHPTVPKQKPIIETLYKKGYLYYYPENLAAKVGVSDVDDKLGNFESRVGSPFAVIDPRYLGYEFPSYTFIETENNLEDGFNTKPSHFNRPENILHLGAVLGDIDLIQRRIDVDRWENAEFAKWVKSRLSYFERFETYPVFQIARWYGKDRTEPLVSEADMDKLNKKQNEVINCVRENPRILCATSDSFDLDDIELPSELKQYKKQTIATEIQELEEKGIVLGSSITYDINNSPWKCAIMGISLGSKGNRNQAEGPRMELNVDHDHVVNELQNINTDLINNFTMPFITSGVGQDWADILLEFRVEDIHNMDDIAERIRSIDYVKTTQTYIMSDSLINNGPK